MKLSYRYIALVGVLLISAAAVLVWLVYDQMRQQALIEAEHKASIILDRNLATHTYFTHDLKPAVFKLLKDLSLPGYFEPIWMSSTYAVRGIDHYFKQLSPHPYYYKECAINARTPWNEADPFERAFIEKINADPKVVFQSGIRKIDGQPFYEVLRRGEVMEQSCLRCHSTPPKAPAGMLEIYGDERSFGRHEGEVVSAISIRIPLDEALSQVSGFTVKLALGIAGVLAGVGLIVLWLNSRFFTRPLERMRRQTSLIARRDDSGGGGQLPLDFPGEWNLLADDFNVMSRELKEIYDGLEDQVEERTRELQTALNEVKTLSGLLPICANCKKIRDDKGYWHQVDKYIHQHSDAEFTHGICPDCRKKLYPGY